MCVLRVQVLEQSLLSRDSALSAVMEKGKTLLSLLHSPSIMENLDGLQSDYQELRNTARVRRAHTRHGNAGSMRLCGAL